MKEIITEKAKRDVLANDILEYLKKEKELYHRGDWNEGWYNAKDKSFTLKIDINDYFANIYIFRCKGWLEHRVFGQLMSEGHLEIDCSKKQMELTKPKYYQLANEIGGKFKGFKLLNHCMTKKEEKNER